MGENLFFCISDKPHVRKDINQDLLQLLICLRHHDAGKAVGGAIVDDDELVVADAFSFRIGRSFEDMENRLLAVHGDRLRGDGLVVWRSVARDFHGSLGEFQMVFHRLFQNVFLYVYLHHESFIAIVREHDNVAPFFPEFLCRCCPTVGQTEGQIIDRCALNETVPRKIVRRLLLAARESEERSADDDGEEDSVHPVHFKGGREKIQPSLDGIKSIVSALRLAQGIRLGMSRSVRGARRP